MWWQQQLVGCPFNQTSWKDEARGECVVIFAIRLPMLLIVPIDAARFRHVEWVLLWG